MIGLGVILGSYFIIPTDSMHILYGLIPKKVGRIPSQFCYSTILRSCRNFLISSRGALVGFRI